MLRSRRTACCYNYTGHVHVGLLRTSVFMLTLLSGPIEFDMWITPHWNQYTINLVTLHHSRFPSAPFPLLPSGGINRFITPELEQMVGNSAGFFVVVFSAILSTEVCHLGLFPQCIHIILLCWVKFVFKTHIIILLLYIVTVHILSPLACYAPL